MGPGEASNWRLSPDGKILRFSIITNGPNALWEASADGSNLHLVFPEGEDACCGNWTLGQKYFVFQKVNNERNEVWVFRESAGLFGGKFLLLGGWPDTGNAKLRMFDVEMRILQHVPGSEGMMFVIWSPNGNYIAALKAVDGDKHMFYNIHSRVWRAVESKQELNFWDWSHDSEYLYFDVGEPTSSEVMRYRVKDGKIEKVASIPFGRPVPGTAGFWFGLGPGDAPMVLRETAAPQIFAIDWEAP